MQDGPLLLQVPKMIRHLIPIGPVILLKEPHFVPLRETSGELGKDLRMVLGPVQLNQKSCLSTLKQSDIKTPGKVPSHFESSGIPTSVRTKSRLRSSKPRALGEKHLAACVLTGEDQLKSLRRHGAFLHRFRKSC